MGRLRRSSIIDCRSLAVMSALAFAGCGLDPLFEDGLTFNVPIPSCEEVRAGPLLVQDLQTPLEVGASRLVGVSGPGPFDLLAAVCDGQIASVTWASLEPGVVRVETPERGFGAYVTGVSEGVGAVTAEVAFVDGETRSVAPAEVSVVPAAGAPAAAELVTTRTLVFESASAGCAVNSSSCSHEHFSLERGGELIVVADWVSPLNRVAFNVFNGHCSDTSTCHMPTVLGGGRLDGKPIRVEEPGVPPGPYTLRIGNGGPGPETVVYEIWLRPG